jgi:hypothetical protein
MVSPPPEIWIRNPRRFLRHDASADDVDLRAEAAIDDVHNSLIGAPTRPCCRHAQVVLERIERDRV